ncbi:MAG: thioether cross-link-forming SCIFF peptide maturase, partial [Eubacterium sp.]|nr:thioether cross-link-forming SCIFF peptide maturase [Eubacterium sp.]
MVHLYKNNGYNIVLDVNSGSIHVVDDVVYDTLELMKEKEESRYEKETLTAITEKITEKYKNDAVTEADMKEVYEDIKELEENGTLFSRDVYKDGVIDFKKRQTVVKALCLHIAHDCNLACRYCFAGEGEYKGDRSLMSYEVGKKALDFLVENSGSRRNLEVDFFGGEPLLNFDVVKKLVAYGREIEKEKDKHFRFTLTTNGVLLNDDIIEFANEEMDNIVLSIDGRKEVHDHMRPFKNGTGSYDFIIDKFKKVAESRNQSKYYVRGTFTHYNLDFVKDVLSLADEG